MITQRIGMLCTISGTVKSSESFFIQVTRTTEVKPELVKGAFQCTMCGKVIHGVEQQFKYTEVTSFTAIDGSLACA